MINCDCREQGFLDLITSADIGQESTRLTADEGQITEDSPLVAFLITKCLVVDLFKVILVKQNIFSIGMIISVKFLTQMIFIDSIIAIFTFFPPLQCRHS